MGVSGFLISCAIRRATSAQATVRCAVTSSVTSSKVTMAPKCRPRLVSLRIRTMKVRRCPLRIRETSPSITLPDWLRACCNNAVISGTSSTNGRPVKSSTTVSSEAAAELLARVMTPSPSRPTTPAETPLNTASVNRRRRSMRRLAAISSSCCSANCPAMRLKARLRELISS